MNRVDVIIPCYNYGRYLPGCVGSVLDQAGVDVRVLIIDDASPDGSGQIAEELARRDERIEVRRHAVNRGHIATYNEGLQWVAADYALLLSADDLLVPGAFLRATALLGSRPDAGMVYGRQILFDSDEPPPAPQQHAVPGDWAIVSGIDFIAECCRTGGNPVPTPSAVVRSSLWKQLGGYRQDLPHTADMELWLRFAAHAAVGKINADQALKRVHAGNMQHQYVTAGLGDIPHRLAAFEVLFSKWEHRLAGSLRVQARATLAEQAFWAASSAYDRGDLAACQECLTCALQLDPELPSGPSWARFRLKRRLGPRLWRFVQPVFENIRSFTRRAAVVV